jgi:putative ribosome biogenesis GTPase RsgA
MEFNFHLKDFGWDLLFEKYFEDLKRGDLVPARVAEEFKGLYKVQTAQGEYLAEVADKVQHQAADREDFPAVGDWVAILARPEEARARIEYILPRKTRLARKAAGREQTSIAPGTPVQLLSAVERTSREMVQGYLARGNTAAFVTSSGVGKSTIINGLANTSLRVQPVREQETAGGTPQPPGKCFFSLEEAS